MIVTLNVVGSVFELEARDLAKTAVQRRPLRHLYVRFARILCSASPREECHTLYGLGHDGQARACRTSE